MGNSQTKEQRPPGTQLRSGHLRRNSSPLITSPTSSSSHGPSENTDDALYSSRLGRGSRSELSTLLGLAGNVDSSTGIEIRRETKQEREARKLERERILREKERERSMREESVDGGFLVTQGVYTGIEDYNKPTVRQLMIERRIAPFWRGLNDHSSSWTEHQLVAAARGLPIPAPDEIPNEELLRSASTSDFQSTKNETNLNSLTVPMASRTHSFNSDSSTNLSPSQPTFSLPPSSPTVSGSALLRGRAKTLASLTSASRNSPQAELVPREMHLPKDPYVNGQPIEAYLYKDAAECPICFLYYPPYLNRTRCCDQAICSECFVQIKRPDPHPPEHADPTAPPHPPSENSETDPDATLVSEPAACPFCVQPEFGVTYEPPPFRRGLTYVNPTSGSQFTNVSSAMSSSSSLVSFNDSRGQPSPIRSDHRRRAASLSANAPTVITTDRVRPDWATKLSTARAHAARRSAAATALHTAAYLMGNRNDSPDSRGFIGFGRRGMLRRGNGADSPGSTQAQLNMLALMAERYGAANGTRPPYETTPTIVGPPRESSRRNRMEDLEDMMMMEAIRLSLASEEERRKREEKEAKKEAKKKAKEEKKAEKVSRKTGVYPSSSNSPGNTAPGSAIDIGKGKGAASRSSDNDLPSQWSNSMPTESSASMSPQVHLERSRAQLHSGDTLNAFGSSPYRPSHLRNLSTASSSGSSSAESVGERDVRDSHSSLDPSPDASAINILREDLQNLPPTPTNGGAGTEPMFNFRSLAAMIGNDVKPDIPEQAENTDDPEMQPDKAESLVGLGSADNAGPTEATLDESIATLKPDDSAEAEDADEALKESEIMMMDHEGTIRETGSV